MELIKPSTAGTLESSDVQILLQPNSNNGITIHLSSSVQSMFGDAIEKTVRTVLEEFGVKNAMVDVNDQGALDVVIRSRMQCAICRGLETRFDWGKEDPNA